MSALLSFLGGSAFRMIWGEVSAFVTKAQDHKHEKELLTLQQQAEASAHARNLENLKLQSDLGIKKVYVEHQAAVDEGELDAWIAASKSTGTNTGVAWIDGWNQSIRPGVATIAIFAMVTEIALLGSLTDWHKEVFSAALGLFLADRSLTKRGK
jgi:hypothetical protein